MSKKSFKSLCWIFPGSRVVRTLLPLQEARVWFLVEWLRCLKLHGMAKNKIKNKKNATSLCYLSFCKFHLSSLIPHVYCSAPPATSLMWVSLASYLHATFIIISHLSSCVSRGMGAHLGSPWFLPSLHSPSTSFTESRHLLYQNQPCPLWFLFIVLIQDSPDWPWTTSVCRRGKCWPQPAFSLPYPFLRENNNNIN